MNKNADRAKYHLLPVVSSYEITEDHTYEKRRFIFVNKHEQEMSSPGYLRKIIMLDSTRKAISYEQDYFKNPAEGRWLVVSHNYVTSETGIELQAENTTEPLNIFQADSILSAWKIAENPFKQK